MSSGSKRGKLPVRILSALEAMGIGIKYLVRPGRFTLRYPEEYAVLHEGYRGFIILDEEKCIGCASCARICPASAMKMVKLPRKQRPVINYQRCIFCGFCVDVCPVQALRHQRVHDVCYYGLNELKLSLDDFKREIRSPAELEGGKPIRFEFDEKKGLIKLTSEEERR